MARRLECHRCGYIWEYSGTFQKATCPSCSAKVPVERQSTEESLEDIAADYDLSVRELKEILRRVRPRKES
ncbi:hypothetical protein [Halegenticoccus soli]|uniref:hypothetical protein n=1 Tax=Halegenticoccus soli TaxID=1985678 RepID=UPI000C6CAC87|nr:hypothetical protein [Halegenticoccus soli]